MRAYGSFNDQDNEQRYRSALPSHAGYAHRFAYCAYAVHRLVVKLRSGYLQSESAAHGAEPWPESEMTAGR